MQNHLRIVRAGQIIIGQLVGHLSLVRVNGSADRARVIVARG